MLPRAVQGARLTKIEMETIKDQLAPAGVPGTARFNALTRRSWVASGHSVFQVTKGNVKKLVVDSGFQSYEGVYKDIPNAPAK